MQTENDTLSALKLDENIERYLNESPRDIYHGEGAEDFGEEFTTDSEVFEEFDYDPYLDDFEAREDQIEDNDDDEESEIEKIVEEEA